MQKISFQKQTSYPRSIQAVVSRHYVITVRKGDTELLETLNEGLDLLMVSPGWVELIEKYKLG